MKNSNNGFQSIKFSASGWEYLKLYWTNFLPSLLTLGVYSAWAKVRRQRYLLGHTQIAGSSFDYTAQPQRILKGRIIALILVTLYYFIEYFPVITIITALILFYLLVPILVVGAFRFRAANTRWRNIAFSFQGTYRQAYRIYFFYYLLGVLSAGLLYPYYQFKNREFLLNNLCYGTQKFSFTGTLPVFYKYYFQAVLLFVLALLPFFIYTYYKYNIGFSGSIEYLEILLFDFMDLLVTILFVFVPFLIAYEFLRVRFLYYTLNNTTLGEVKIRNDIKFLMMLYIMLTNVVLVLVSFGIFLPWARLRKIRYIYTHVYYEASPSINNFYSGKQEGVSALGDAANDSFGFDIGL